MHGRKRRSIGIFESRPQVGCLPRQFSRQKSYQIVFKNRGIVLLSHLYGIVKDLCNRIEDEVIDSNYGTGLIVETIYKRDPLPVVSLIFPELQKLLATRRGFNESYRNLEARLGGQLAKFTSLYLP